MKIRVNVLLILFVCTAILGAYGTTCSADAGPKPSITIIVENTDGEDYYLDLLIPYKGEYENISEEERGSYDSDMLAVLENYDTGGWYAALVTGTDAPLFGDLEGDTNSGMSKHRFSYIIPDKFKIIIVTPDLEIKTSEEIEVQLFNETIYLDYESMSLRRADPGFLSYLKQFAGTFLPTIIIEGLLLILFGFSLRKNWKIFLLLNLLTQIILTVVMSFTLIHFGLVTSYFFFVPTELVIFVIEAVVFTKMLKEHRTSRRLIYALTANFTSAAAGLFLVPFWFENIFR